jgi:uncharacterized membrane protein
MKVKGMLIGTLLVVAAMLGFAFWVAAGLPAGAELPTHWNAAGEVDDTMPALPALLIAPGSLLFVGLVLAALPRLEPRKENLAQSQTVVRVVWIGLIIVMTVVQLMIAGPALGWNLGVQWIALALGALLIALGDALPKSRPNFFVGIRTPWTLTDTDNWVATHRLGGRLMMLAGLAIALCGILPIGPSVVMAVVFGSVFAAAIVPLAYSWWLWRKKKQA